MHRTPARARAGCNNARPDPLLIKILLLILLLCPACGNAASRNFAPRNAQIILTESGGPISALLALIPDEFYPFSHSGIIAVEDGKAYVYEARGAYKMGTGRPAADWFKKESGIRRTSLKQYVEREGYAVVYDPPPGVDAKQVIAFAQQRYQAGTPFDPYFDFRTGNRLYCAEFVSDALRTGGWKGMSPVPNRSNPSLQAVLNWWGIKAKSTLPVGSLVSGLHKAKELGDQGARTNAIVFNAFKKEIYRRFTPNQKLGNIFKFDGDLEFRPAVRKLLVNAEVTLEPHAPALTLDLANSRVKALATRMFGPLN